MKCLFVLTNDRQIIENWPVRYKNKLPDCESKKQDLPNRHTRRSEPKSPKNVSGDDEIEMSQTVTLAASATATIPALQRDIVYLCGAYLGDQGRLTEVVSLLKIQKFMK